MALDEVLAREVAAGPARADAPAPAAGTGRRPGTGPRHAAARIGQHYHQVTAHVAEHRSLPVRLTDTGARVQNAAEENRASAVYLDTVSWWGPTAEDRDTARLLAGMFFDHERATGLRHGYDPFGRLVVHCATAHAFAVQWPATAAPASSRVSQ